MSQTASRSAGASGRSSSRSVAMGSAGRNMRRIYPSGMTRTGGRLGTFPPAPQPLRVPVPDSHTHLDITLSEGGGGGPRTVKEAIELAAAAGVDRLVQVGTEVGSSRWSADLAEEHRAVLATVALHPNEAPRLSDLDGALREIESVAGRDRRSEEHTSELQSHHEIVCRLLLEKKKKKKKKKNNKKKKKKPKKKKQNKNKQ